MRNDLPACAEKIHPIEATKEWLSRCSQTGKLRLSLRSGATEVPVLLMNGSGKGAVLVATAAVHGDEYEGVRALFELFEELDPTRMNGRLLLIPVAHPSALRAGTRRSEADDKDLARCFPGDPAGSPTERVAALLAEHVIAHADLFVDLHSGGVRFEMPSMVGCDDSDPKSIAAAEAFGADVLWLHNVIPPGRTISFAKSRKIPCLYTEAHGAGRIVLEDLEMMKRGMRNLMGLLGIFGDKPVNVPPRYRLCGDGNTDCGIEAGADGFLIVKVKMLDAVAKDAVLGVLTDLYGRVLETYAAPVAGTVGLIHQFARVRRGETLFLLAEKE